MLNDVINLLRTSDFKNASQNIEIAKGSNELKKSFKDQVKQVIRNKKWQKRK